MFKELTPILYKLVHKKRIEGKTCQQSLEFEANKDREIGQIPWASL